MTDEQSKNIFRERVLYYKSENPIHINNIIKDYVKDMDQKNQNDIMDVLGKIANNNPIILYGAGKFAKLKLEYFLKDNRVKFFCDNDPLKQKMGVLGLPVLSLEDIGNCLDYNYIITTPDYLLEAEDVLMKKGVKKSNIYQLREYGLCQQKGTYFDTDFMTFEDVEVLIDAGSCDLWTISCMQKYCTSLKKVYAFEPDKNNYLKCLKNASDYKGIDIKVFNKGTWSDEDILCFEALNNSCSHISDLGTEKIEVDAIDNIVDLDEKVTFIKMDVEGAELESLKGAYNIIRKNIPKLAISIYHKPEDLFEIPVLIKSIYKGYKLYLRHHSNGMEETVLYAMPE